MGQSHVSEVSPYDSHSFCQN